MDSPRPAVFRFKQFSVSNSLSAMKVGTDGVLLGAWSQIAPGVNSGHVLDVGCGTGVVGLMIAQRYPGVTVTCLDISGDAVRECAANIAASPFHDRMEAGHADFLSYDTQRRFDLIVSNPPYFKDSLPSPAKARNMARHDESLPLSGLLKRASALLNPSGRIALVLPVERDSDVVFEATLAGLQPVRRCAVFTVEGKPQRRTLWELSLSAPASCDDSRLFIHDKSGDYSKEYVSLLKDFYLAF